MNDNIRKTKINYSRKTKERCENTAEEVTQNSLVSVFYRGFVLARTLLNVTQLHLDKQVNCQHVALTARPSAGPTRI